MHAVDVVLLSSPPVVVRSQKSTLFFHGSATPPLRGDLHGDSGRSTTSSVVSGSSSRPHSSRSNKSRKSLEGIFETSEPSTKPGLLALLEVYTQALCVLNGLLYIHVYLCYL